jgi:hypothetical protein
MCGSEAILQVLKLVIERFLLPQCVGRKLFFCAGILYAGQRFFQVRGGWRPCRVRRFHVPFKPGLLLKAISTYFALEL